LGNERLLIATLAHSLSLPSPRWDLAGNTIDIRTTIIDLLSQASETALLIIPIVKLHNSPACDTGGIFRDVINTVFNYLLRGSDLFEREKLEPYRYRFPTFIRTLLPQRRRLYQEWYICFHDNRTLEEIWNNHSPRSTPSEGSQDSSSDASDEEISNSESEA
jgi:hypothetical protein